MIIDYACSTTYRNMATKPDPRKRKLAKTSRDSSIRMATCNGVKHKWSMWRAIRSEIKCDKRSGL